MELLGNPVFLIFGGGAIIAIVAILADTYSKAHKRKMDFREREREHARALEQRLLGLDDHPVIEGVSLRLDALEADMREIKALLWAQAEGPVGLNGPKMRVLSAENEHGTPEQTQLEV